MKTMQIKKRSTGVQVFEGIGLLAAAVVIVWLLRSTMTVKTMLPKLETGVGLGIVLVFGLLTSIHCVGMCGGLMLSQCVSTETSKNKPRARAVIAPPLFYNVGRIISYTAIGAAVGGIGQALSLSGFLKGLIPIVGGVFMILLALNTLGIFPVLRHIHFGLPNRAVKKLVGNNAQNGEHVRTRGPLVLGLLTGLMPCMPLQMAQAFALSTRSAGMGALVMLVFAVGTVPGLFALGSLSSFANRRFRAVMVKLSAVVIVFLGVFMVGRGLSLNGITNPFGTSMSSKSMSNVSSMSGMDKNAMPSMSATSMQMK
ncbi:sulfite exporter TauE/SafE family protein [Ethanoligenens harbinense]|nr:sulfite exporter TauE/SafE family protein [Ethanoligenens harbinense YUAN-3]AYF38334.1 sulfite exporter TauE/SafE family protein [Ethanoligenens harbinense]AYF41079.1 sulfite exporter TauE/SafE family protein [Ethanoligenens harbinense]QCN91910.1 sulfite exporter TauE/SafE family protein [Ethanoligenens harbinense]